VSDQTHATINEEGMPEQDFLNDPLMDHSYDGIQEYDNPLPGWWKFLFWATIIFSPFYYFYFHMGPESRTIYGEYQAHKNRITEASFKEIGDLKPEKQLMLDFLQDRDKQKWRDFGKSVYQTNCATCHGSEGEGGVGPNLTDSAWKNVRSIEDIAKIVENGAGNGAMPAWKNRLSHQNHIILVSVYVASLKDNPRPGTRPEGNITIDSWD
jgi:cytochrome c oxidase cbb3-type subunit 3